MCLPDKRCCTLRVLANGRHGDDYERRAATLAFLLRPGRETSRRVASRRAEPSRVDGEEASRVGNTMHYAQHVRQQATRVSAAPRRAERHGSPPLRLAATANDSPHPYLRSPVLGFLSNTPRRHVTASHWTRWGAISLDVFRNSSPCKVRFDDGSRKRRGEARDSNYLACHV